MYSQLSMRLFTVFFENRDNHDELARLTHYESYTSLLLALQSTCAYYIELPHARNTSRVRHTTLQ